MKNIVTCILFSCALTSIIHAQDTLTIYFDNNWNEISDKSEAMYYRKAFADSDNTWLVQDYYKSNTLQMAGRYKTKKCKAKQGYFTYYYENGNKKSEGNYSNNKSEGTWVYWYDNEQKQAEGGYTANKARGTWRYWHDGGEMKAEGQYVNDRKDGTWQYWYRSGQLQVKEIYKNGFMGGASGYYENGAMSFEGSYVNNMENGIWTYWNADGRVVFKGNLKNGVKDGEWVRSFRDSEMKLLYNNGVVENKHLGGIFKKEPGDQ